jgi:hypothetical protein
MMKRMLGCLAACRLVAIATINSVYFIAYFPFAT